MKLYSLINPPNSHHDAAVTYCSLRPTPTMPLKLLERTRHQWLRAFTPGNPPRAEITSQAQDVIRNDVLCEVRNQWHAAMSNDGEKCATCGEPLDDHSMDELIYCWRYAHPRS